MCSSADRKRGTSGTCSCWISSSISVQPRITPCAPRDASARICVAKKARVSSLKMLKPSSCMMCSKIWRSTASLSGTSTVSPCIASLSLRYASRIVGSVPSKPTVVRPRCLMARAVQSAMCSTGRDGHSFAMAGTAMWPVFEAMTRKSAPARTSLSTLGARYALTPSQSLAMSLLAYSSQSTLTIRSSGLGGITCFLGTSLVYWSLMPL
mmetsp:Transcript_42787/g.96595  ORF Transcript_42787/g.96595 Transcript_42787/m.96595 type:complete len:209 (+) Transcript_42787:295-921(+)